ncbi:MAG: AbrB/MazE/SpoVT family DNA-binding domain-containing protein [Silvibacterium sp.]|nr:AbrB/MazE/SpoVT family DNA-binding domain-containing protein [Silvibacterium sp.]MBV8438787.1 AbrB/MazE/SpoVT family DNA-binding domain-containing protein [Silvibacterium sp.]
MQTRISTKGQIVLPSPLRRRLGIEPGDPLDVEVEAGRIVLTPRKKRHKKGRIIKDPASGFPVLSAGPDAPVLTSKEVTALLSNFP